MPVTAALSGAETGGTGLCQNELQIQVETLPQRKKAENDRGRQQRHHSMLGGGRVQVVLVSIAGLRLAWATRDPVEKVKRKPKCVRRLTNLGQLGSLIFCS